MNITERTGTDHVRSYYVEGVSANAHAPMRLILAGSGEGTPGQVMMTFLPRLEPRWPTTETAMSVKVDNPERFGQTFDKQWVETFLEGFMK